ncbi:MAG: formimidoylglutamase [Gammaproteobacteria bacterium]|nr:formimidoylglutamase [Gammaproteobacteria bacterium]
MFKPAEMSLWQGRIDDEADALRLHQVIKPLNNNSNIENSSVLLGFACDEGVRRNHGRPGAKDGPAVIRRALSNVAWHHDSAIFDGGDVICEGPQLEAAQQLLADKVTAVLNHNGRPLILGGGHEIAWGSFLGLSNHLQQTTPKSRIGIINLDAHFDLRAPTPEATSGTPFRQIAELCHTQQQPFNYMVLGINPLANTTTLFEFASSQNVTWRYDTDCTHDQLPSITQQLDNFCQQIDELYFTICLDVFAPHSAPGVSAPSTIGIEPQFALQLIEIIKQRCTQHHVAWRVSDIAEMNPIYDIDQRTARLAARLIESTIKLHHR